MTFRETNGRFKTAPKIVAWGLVFGVAVMIASAALSSAFATEKIVTTTVTEDTLTPKVEQLKSELLAKLEKCESAGRNEEDGIVVLDSNGVGSYGVMQWQRKSVMYYQEKRTGQKINGRDAILLAMDADKARNLAEWTIFESGSGLKDWSNCDRKFGLTQELGFINKLK